MDDTYCSPKRNGADNNKASYSTNNFEIFLRKNNNISPNSTTRNKIQRELNFDQAQASNDQNIYNKKSHLISSESITKYRNSHTYNSINNYNLQISRSTSQNKYKQSQKNVGIYSPKAKNLPLNGAVDRKSS